MEPTIISDDESLYRSIKSDSEEYAVRDGRVVFSTTAFNDRSKKPSVDRSAFRSNPEDVKRGPEDGVVGLVTREVRAICDIEIDGKNSGQTFAVDAIHRPIAEQNGVPGNVAHSQIECCPTIATGSRFRKLKESLAMLASKRGFIVHPRALSVSDLGSGGDPSAPGRPEEGGADRVTSS